MAVSAEQLAAVKRYMRVDGTEDDVIIESMYGSAVLYLKNAGIEEPKEDPSLYNLAVWSLTLHYYDHRDAVGNEASFPMEDVGDVEVLEFVDNGYTGTHFERPSFQEMLDLVREGKIHCVIVKDFTRFGRNSIEVGYFMEKVFPLYPLKENEASICWN